MQNSALDNAAVLAGRLLLAAIFVQEGWNKIGGYDAAVAYMAKAGVSGALLPLVIAVELLGGLLIAVGWQTRLVALGLALFTLLAAVFFHTNFADRNQAIHFMKNVAIAGGFLVLCASGPGALSIDGRRGR
jgi:putative oxidoreductase